MTLDEKIGQLAQFSAGYATGPGASNLKWDELAAKGQVGSFLNVVGAEATNHYQHLAVEKTRLHIPILFGQDVIHGHRTTFPVPLAVAASWDPAAAETVARTGAMEARADGIPWVFSPMVDIARDPRWGRIVESNGEDPYLGSAMARAWVKGYQQDDLSKPDSVAVSVKHFAAYGAAIAGRDYNAVDMSEITLRQVYLEPYRAAVEAGAATVMSSFNSINGVPGHRQSLHADPDSAQGVGLRRLCRLRLGRGRRAAQPLHRRRPHRGPQGSGGRRGHGHGGQPLRNGHRGPGARGQDSRERGGRGGAPHSARQVCAGALRPSLHRRGPAYERHAGAPRGGPQGGR